MSGFESTRTSTNTGSLLALPAGEPYERDDPVLRHQQARADREHRQNLLNHSAEPDDQASHDAPRASQEVAPRVSHEVEEQLQVVSPRAAVSWRRRILATTVAGSALGLAFGLSTPSSYVATTELMGDPRALLAADGPTADALVESRLRLLTSGAVLRVAADRLNLDDDPEYNGQTSGSLLSRLSALVGADDPAPAAERREIVTIATLGDSLEAARAGGGIGMVLSARSSNADKSALVANTVAEIFLQTYGDTRIDIGSSADPEARLVELREAVEAAELAVETYRAENGLIDAQGRPITDDEIAHLNDQLSAARARTIDLNARAATARDANVDTIVTGSLPEQVASAVLTDLRAQYSQLSQQADGISVRLGPLHPDRVAVEAQLEGLRGRIADELRRTAAAIQVELKRAVQQEQELAAQLARLKVRQGDIGVEQIRLRELEREAAAKRVALEDVLQARGGNATAGSEGIRVISRAEPPIEAAGPSLAETTLGGMLAGFLAGIGLAAFRRTARGENNGAEAPTVETGAPADNPVLVAENAADLAEPAPSVRHQAEPAYRTDEPDDLQHDFDPRTEAAIDEIRARLREFRDAIEDLAETREPGQRRDAA